MMPFSVLRLWGLGLLGWGLLAAGLYLAWQGTQPERHVDVRVLKPGERLTTPGPDGGPGKTIVAPEARPGEPPMTTTIETVVPAAAIPARRWMFWIGVALSFVSVGGAVPILPFLGRPPLFEPHAFTSTRTQSIKRPDGSVLHVEHHGPEKGRTIVLTHGWSLSLGDWYFVRKSLGDRYHLVLWDLPGLGKSTEADNHDQSLEKMANDLKAVVDEATGGHAVLVGHSIGGMIQQVFCRLHPDMLGAKVAGLAFVHTTYVNPCRTAWFAKLLLALQKPLIEPLNYLTIALAPLCYIQNWQSYLNGSLHLTSRFTSFAGGQSWGMIDFSSRMAASAWPAVMARGNQAMLLLDERATLPSVKVPTLVVTGRDDRLTKPEATATIASLLPRSKEIELAPAGHLGHWERHGGFTAALADFVDALPGGHG